MTNETLSDLILGGYSMAGWCPTEGTSRGINLHDLAERLGADYQVSKGFRFRCSKCGCRVISITISPPSR